MLLHECAFNFLKIPPLPALEFESFHHKRIECQKIKQTEKPLPTSHLNLKQKYKHNAHNNLNKKQLTKLAKTIAPNFTIPNHTNKSYKFISSESCSDYYHRIDKLNKTKLINFLSILANITQAAASLHQMKNTLNL